MRSPRSWIGEELRKAGVIQPVVDRFTDTQMEQLRALVGSALRAAISMPGGLIADGELRNVAGVVPVAVDTVLASEAEADRRGPDTSILDAYATAAPSAQLTVDIFMGEWSSNLPSEVGVTTGQAGLFEDSRIDRVIEWFGNEVSGARVLELGPLEGGHTYMLEHAGADVCAIESNSRAFLKCLIVKELLDLRRARFMYGDFTAYLKNGVERFDLVLASGVLYHMVNPVELLTLIAGATDRVAIWTHYYDDVLTTSPTAHQFQRDPELFRSGQATYTLHPRDYLEALSWGGFCGGPETYARWMERDEILDCLSRLGFSDITISHDHPDHPNGPAFLVLAHR